jgi:hypothetical protein
MPAEKGNRHNQKHGLYSRVIRTQETRELDKMSHDLINEIDVMRIYIARLSDYLNALDEYGDDAHTKLDIVTRMCQTVGVLTSRRAALLANPVEKGEAIAAGVALSASDWDKV